ncbi:MAG: type III PLP-dependent enzyme [Pseudomonadota bacterium]
MLVTHAEFGAGHAVDGLSRVENHIRNTHFDQPTLVLDIDRVESQFRALRTGLGRANIHYAVKANPHPAIIRRLVALGAHFDAASRGEIELCLAQGAKPDSISFGNTVKRARDIAFAHKAGVTLYAADAVEELDKIAEHAPCAAVYIRLIVDASGADWPLTRKFGTSRENVLPLLSHAQTRGLKPVGLSFHVGSQTRDPAMWDDTLDEVAGLWHAAKGAGFDLSVLNIGGGFPAYYGDAITEPTVYAASVMARIADRFGDVPHIMAEPGRGLVAEAGAIAAEILLVAQKSENDLHRWVYLDIGKFSGLAETIDEAIRYQFLTERDHEETGPCIVAGPSCDSADVLYEQRPVQMPLGLRAGDRVIIRNAGAYTSSYSSVGFNGFPPLDVVLI